MGKPSRDKGYRFENSLRKRLNVFIGNLHGGTPNKDQKDIQKEQPGCMRVPLSGALAGWPGDLILTLPDLKQLLIECKSRKSGAGFKLLYKWLGDNDCLMLKEDRKETLVVMTLPNFLDLLTKICYKEECK